MKKNEKGFTLVELLAVIVILGLLMAIAIPSVTKYITQSRKKTLMSTMDSYVTAVTNAVNDNEFGAMSKEDTMYYIPVSNDESNSCVSLEKGGTNPFGNWKEAYVVVNYDSTNYSYDYYFTFYDDAGYGMELTKIEEIDANGSMIKNPSPVNADNITTQKNNRASNVEVLTAGTCKANSLGNGSASGGGGSPEAPKVTTLAGTTWKMNDNLTRIDIFTIWANWNQTGNERFPSNCIMKNSVFSYSILGFTRNVAFGAEFFSTVYSSGSDSIGYVFDNSLGLNKGWYIVSAEASNGFLSGSETNMEVLMTGVTPTTTPTVIFSNESNSALENTQLIDWMYENAEIQ